MLAVPGRRRIITLATVRVTWRKRAGIMTTVVKQRTRWEAKRRTLLDYTICTETFRSGVTTGMGITAARMRMILKGRQTAPPVSRGAAAGAIASITADWPTATTPVRAPGTTTWVSELCGVDFPKNFSAFEHLKLDSCLLKGELRGGFRLLMRRISIGL